MKYGLNLLLWTPEVTADHAPLLADIKRWGYDGAELPMFSGDEAAGKALGKLCDDAGLARTAVTVCTPENNPISPDATVRAAATDHLKKILDCCAAAGAETLCGPVHSALGQFSEASRTEEEWKRAVDVLSVVADHAEDVGVTIAVEAINRFECYFVNSQQEVADFAAAIDKPALGCMYDTFHANIEEKDPAAALRHAASQLRHVHISENDRSTPGEGQIRWEETFAGLKEIGYDGWLVIEAFGLALPQLAAATRIWRRMFPSEEHLAVNGLAFMKKHSS
ncbi:sugar phosphate isomerase/epimerase family protein [Alienimonas californiensis]|uniref:D-tagatose 3-epimerase n=1 Tax=Alienimonas californiensis TaxID=2527989 RepID=A0A517PDA1_9PLAN|nr:sugar phosphate isomerase/epimerase family protein [Alienimonas californiensis]QDT17353.1 D-tagatose 3-epimerase [Alienimonas californiensis]